MCLIVKKGTEITVTEEDMTVYKIVSPSLSDGQVRAQFNMYWYIDGVVARTELAQCPPEDGTFLDFTDIDMVKKMLGMDDGASGWDALNSGRVDAWKFGFHFFSTLESAELHDDSDGTHIARFVIPAGSAVIISETGLGITDTIMYTSEFK